MVMSDSSQSVSIINVRIRLTELGRLYFWVASTHKLL